MKVVSFVFPRFAISLKIARQFFDQLAVVSWSYVFSRVWTPLTFLASSSDWFIWLSVRFVMSQSTYFVSGLTCLTSQVWPFPYGKEITLHKPSKRREFPSTFDPHVELFYGDCYLYFQLSPQVRESKTVLDSGFLAVDPGFWILCQLNFLSVSPSNFPQFCCCAKNNFFCCLFLNKITFIFLNRSDFRSV